ncbi:MAG: TRAP transporter small permease [Chloroflexi bacterium]|nr:TRAP transporter small permease [Chloroflexota bacterium]
MQAQQTFIDPFLNKIRLFNRWFLAIPMVTMLAMMVFDSVNVISIRFFSFRIIPAQKEFIEEFIIIVVYGGLAYVLLERGHIKTDLVVNQLGRTGRFIAQMVADFFCIVVTGYITYATTIGLMWTLANRSAKQGDIIIPLAPFYIMITFSFGLFLFCSILLTIKHVSVFRLGPAVKARPEPEIILE